MTEESIARWDKELRASAAKLVAGLKRVKVACEQVKAFGEAMSRLTRRIQNLDESVSGR